MVHLSTVQRPPRCPTGPSEAVEEWRGATRATLEELLGPWPDHADLAPEIVSERHLPGGVVEQVLHFDAEPIMSVPATLLLPSGGTRQPAVLAIHGHGPGRTEAIEGWGRQLAKAGFVVLAPDLRGFGERSEGVWEGKEWCDLNAVAATMAGRSPLTQNLWDLRRSLDLLVGHPRVDPDRLGAVGFSYGATCTLFLAAIDDRVRAAVVSGFFSSWLSAHRVPSNMCGSQVLPAMLGRIEHGDLGALIAPRALFVESCRDDPLFDWRVAADEVAHLRELGMTVEHRVHDGDHHWVGDGVEQFLVDQLMF
jgi:dienelactone hydrolase